MSTQTYPDGTPMNTRQVVPVYQKGGQIPIAQNGIEGTMGGLTDKGFNYNGAWGGQFQDGGYVMGSYFDEDVREREPNMMEETHDDYNTAMRGMMKSKMALQAALGNPSARRMMSSMPAKYIFTGEERFSDGTFAEGPGAYGTHYMSNRDNYVYPNIQDKGNGELFFNPNASIEDREAIKFNSPEEASYFAKHYKEVAPMMRNFKEFQMGGEIPIAQNGSYKKKIKKTEQNLLKEYVYPVQNRAIARAKQQGIKTGIHNGPLDAIRHSSSAAATSSILPGWTSFIPGVAPLKIAASNVAGIAHEINSPNTWKEHASDLYNNFIGSVVGALPVSEENKHNLLIQAQKKGILSDMGNRKPLRQKPVASKKEMGGSIPGSVGFTYARTQEIPSEGKYAKKTMPSAQNGQEMRYYQEGLDFIPKTINRKGSVIKDDLGQWAHPGEITEIGSNQITMEGVPYPVLGISNTGDVKLMQPGKNYKFKGKKVTEFPMAKNGINNLDAKPLQKLDDLTNFTNYNSSSDRGWLSKYE